jgi:hypothetical protein
MRCTTFFHVYEWGKRRNMKENWIRFDEYGGLSIYERRERKEGKDSGKNFRGEGMRRDYFGYEMNGGLNGTG